MSDSIFTLENVDAILDPGWWVELGRSVLRRFFDWVVENVADFGHWVLDKLEELGVTEYIDRGVGAIDGYMEWFWLADSWMDLQFISTAVFAYLAIKAAVALIRFVAHVVPGV
ncbi:MAG: hypothetical protein AAF532_09630 [Planctomycetota bacterium]